MIAGSRKYPQRPPSWQDQQVRKIQNHHYMAGLAIIAALLSIIGLAFVR